MLVAELGAGVLYSPASASEADDAGALFTATVATGSGVRTMVVGATELACKLSTGSWAPRSQKMETAATLAAMLAPLFASLLAIGHVPMAVTSRAKHASTPFQVNEKRDADWPEQDEAQHHQGDPRWLPEVVDSVDQAHLGPP